MCSPERWPDTTVSTVRSLNSSQQRLTHLVPGTQACVTVNLYSIAWRNIEFTVCINMMRTKTSLDADCCLNSALCCSFVSVCTIVNLRHWVSLVSLFGSMYFTVLNCVCYVMFVWWLCSNTCTVLRGIHCVCLIQHSSCNTNKTIIIIIIIISVCLLEICFYSLKLKPLTATFSLPIQSQYLIRWWSYTRESFLNNIICKFFQRYTPNIILTFLVHLFSESCILNIKTSLQEVYKIITSLSCFFNLTYIFFGCWIATCPKMILISFLCVYDFLKLLEAVKTLHTITENKFMCLAFAASTMLVSF